MKIKVIRQAFYQNTLRFEGDIIDFSGDKLPSWAESLEPKKENETKKDKKEGKAE